MKSQNPKEWQTCPIKDIRTPTEPQVMQITICSRRNDLSKTEKLALMAMENKFGFSHRPEYVRPESQRIYRCGFQRRRVTINPNGIERNVRAHLRKTHKGFAGTIMVTILRHDGKSQFFQVGGRAGDWLEAVGGETKESSPVRDQATLEMEKVPQDSVPEAPTTQESTIRTIPGSSQDIVRKETDTQSLLCPQ